MPPATPVVLTIAGFDPSSGAGITADIKVIAAHNCFGVACPTALTVQSTRGVRRVEPLDPSLVSETLAELASDFTVGAVHIGMLGSGKVALAVADFLAQARLPHVVLDPILKSSSGADLVDATAVEVMIERLFPLAELVTPNLDEAVILAGWRDSDKAEIGRTQIARTQTGGTQIGRTQIDATAAKPSPQAPKPVSGGASSADDALAAMRRTAQSLHSLGAANVVVTGGHLEKAIDLLSFATGRGFEQEVFKAQRQRSTSTHGTGCAFSTALACHLAQDRGLPEAVLLSKAFVCSAIANAQPLGHGNGPLHHLYRMDQQRRPAVIALDQEHARQRS